MQEQKGVQGHEHEHAGDGLYKWLALFVVIIGTFMAMLDSSIVNIAMPKMMSVFGSDLDEAKWILTSYTLMMGVIVPLTGFLSDTFGVKRLYIFALVIFTVGSLLCGFAWSNTTMIIFRVIQAIGGGMIMPVGMSYVFQIFPPNERGMALGFWGISSMAAPAIGPTLGGYMIANMDWRLIFNVNVPIGVFGVIFAVILLKETATKPYEGNFDFIGFISCVAGLASILYVVGEGASIDWEDIKNPLLITLGCFSLLVFVVNELLHPNPLLDLRVLKIYDFSLSQLITAVTTLAMMGGVYILPLFLQSLRGYTAMQTGMLLFPSALASGFMMPISGALFDRYGAKVVTIPGLIIVAAASYELSFLSMDTSRETIMWIAIVRGAGLGLCMMPVNTQAMNAVPRHLFAKATALSTTIRSVMAALGITFITTIMQNKLNNNYARLSEQITVFNQPATDLIKGLQGLFMQNGLSQSEAQGSALSVLYGTIYKQAYLDAMDYAVAVTVVAVIIAIILVFMMSSKKVAKEKSVEHKSAGQEGSDESEAGFAFSE